MYQARNGYAPSATMPTDDSSRDLARGRRIQELRRKLGFTSAAALAERLGVHVRSVENWEGGKPIDGPNLERLALLLDTTTHQIWTGRDGDGPDLEEDPLTRRVASIEGRMAREVDLARFVQSNAARLTALEDQLEAATKRVEAELQQLRELMEGTATAVKALRTSGVAPPQPERVERRQREKRATGGRRQTDPPLPPGR